MPKHSNIAVFTSGGDAPGMNAALRAVVRTGSYYGMDVYGIYRGYAGMLENDFSQLSPRSVNHILQKGGTFLKSARSLEFKEKEHRIKAIENLKARKITGLIGIGGDGTFAGLTRLSEEAEITCVGIPGTIDNDIAGTEYTIGFDTACNTVIDAVDKIRDTALSHNRVFFIEVMGRDSGLIAEQAALASGALMAIVPGRPTAVEDIKKKLDRGAKNKKTSSIIIVSEGAEIPAYKLREEFSLKYPEYESKLTILGHLQRGGSPSRFDRNMASRMGYHAVDFILDGCSDGMVSVINNEILFKPFGTTEQKTHEDLLKLIDILST